jgi:tetratricopeptide (TPR) repeat protein
VTASALLPFEFSKGVFSMRWQFTRVFVLVAALGLITAGCGKYSISNLRATQAFQSGNEMYNKGQLKEALADYDKALGFNPELGYAYFFRGNVYDQMFKATKRGEAENDANLDKAVADYKTAIEKLKASPESADPNVQKILKLSYQYLIAAYGNDKLNDIEKALPIAQDLIATEPNEPTNYQALGKLYEENGMYEQAEMNFKKAIDVKSDDPLAWEVLAGYYDRQGEIQKTLDSLEKRASMEQNNPEAWHSLGAKYSEVVMKNKTLSAQQAKQYVVRGVEAEDKALSINPEYYEGLAFKNILLRQQANYEKDLAVQKKLLADADDYRNRSIALQKKQNAAAAASSSPSKK